MNLQKEKEQIILSASRMTDMPKFYPEILIEEVNKRMDKNIHTLVLWTKHPKSLLVNPLFDFLMDLKSKGIQLYIQLTITGMGGTFIEPNAPMLEDSILVLPKVIELVGKPERIRLRIDPIVKIEDVQGVITTNLHHLPEIVERCSKLGIKTYSFSFLENKMHKKVNKRFDDLGLTILSPNQEEREKMVKWIHNIESDFGVNIYACAVPGIQSSACIDGEYLEHLHDNSGLNTSHKQPFKRSLCGCSMSTDIGGFPPRKCFTGCIYCYGNASK